MMSIWQKGVAVLSLPNSFFFAQSVPRDTGTLKQSRGAVLTIHGRFL